MNENSTTFLIFSIFVFGLGALAGCFSGADWRDKHWQQEAVKHNAAVWKTLPDGTVEWHWKESTQKEPVK